MKQVSVLGSTGSIGRQALDVIASHGEEFRLLAISANSNVELLKKQAFYFRPRYVACGQWVDAHEFPEGTEVFCGEDAACRVARLEEADVVVNGISGLPALEPLLAALGLGKRVALANKESIVCGHELVDECLAHFGGEILPVDSEQSAIFQCMAAGTHDEIEKLWLTASGGPFWKMSREELEQVTVQDALRHPTWSMGNKITIDSATLFNKGLEVLEASYLFHMPASRIDVLIHPQSVVHSLVEFQDGTYMANLSVPDMRLPIQHAMTFPDRIPSPVERLSLAEIGKLEFHKADRERFDGLRLAYAAWYVGGSMPTVYNAANEFAVEQFVQGAIRFVDIPMFVERAMDTVQPCYIGSLRDIYDTVEQTRRVLREWMNLHTI